MKGTVKWYNETKGFGFIITEDNKDIFVHRSGLENVSGGLEPGQAVEFEIEQGEKGPHAIKVKKAGQIKHTGSLDIYSLNVYYTDRNQDLIYAKMNSIDVNN